MIHNSYETFCLKCAIFFQFNLIFYLVIHALLCVISCTSWCHFIPVMVAYLHCFFVIFHWNNKSLDERWSYTWISDSCVFGTRFHVKHFYLISCQLHRSLFETEKEGWRKPMETHSTNKKVVKVFL